MPIVFIVFFLWGSRLAFADGGDSGEDIEGGSDAAPAEPLACSGALCDTTNGAECAVQEAGIGRHQADAASLTFFISAIAIGFARRERRGARRPLRKSGPR
jgi:hypothetical protein